MRFLRKRMRHKRPLAARRDVVIDGTQYKRFDYIDNTAHSYRSLRRAYRSLLIGHPIEAMGKPDDFKGFIEDISEEKAEIVHKGAGWYDVTINGEAVNELSLRKADAEALLNELKD